MTAAEARALIEPFLEPEGWLPIALWRIAQDPLAGRLVPARHETVARAARMAGRETAATLRRLRASSAEEALRASGVAIEESRADPVWGPFVHHAVYSAPPPRVTLYLEALDALLDGAWFARLGCSSLREVVLAHEWFHHLAWADHAPVAARPRIAIMRLGPFERSGTLRAAEEIAAAGFAQAWCGLEWPPEALDCLTLLGADERGGQALIRSLGRAGRGGILTMGVSGDRERSMATQTGPGLR